MLNNVYNSLNVPILSWALSKSALADSNKKKNRALGFVKKAYAISNLEKKKKKKLHRPQFNGDLSTVELTVE